MNFLSGKKTYIIAAIAAAQAAAQSLGYEIPSWAFELLTATGLYTLRDAVKKTAA